MKSRINAIIDPQTSKIIVQTPLPPFNCLALEGGGSRCPAYVGGYKVLDKCGIMDEVVHVSGSSGGAIAALAIVLGYDPNEAESVLLDLNLARFLEGRHSALNQSSLYSKGKVLLSILSSETYSLSSGNEFLEWLRAKVEKKMGNKHATFSDLAKKIKDERNQGENKHKYLYITGTNLSLEIPECKYFSHETTPSMELALAVYISSCIPGVFPLVEYDGCLWGDGGLIRNLPTKIFDDSRFLPKGYGFTSKGVNPGVLALKVDTKDEINQILYGIVREVHLTTASQVATALYNALTQNTDTDEIREARTTIALPDNNIGVLEFTVNMNGKIGLISSAEKVTQDFVENYYDAVYSVNAYENIGAWLGSLSMDEIDDAIAAYEAMQEPSIVASTNTIILGEYIYFLEQYLKFRRQLKRHPECKFDIPIPNQHINLLPLCTNHHWSRRVEYEMNEKIKNIIQKIKYVDLKIESMKTEFNDIPHIDQLTLLHHEFYFENIQALTNLLEAQKILHEEKRDLRVKLGTFIKSEHSHAKQNGKRYADFIQMLNPLLRMSSLSADIVSVLPDPLPVFKYESSSDIGRTVFILDLRNEADRILYIIAVIMYLGHNKSLNKDIFLNIYRELVPKNIPFPKNIKELGAVFQMSGVELLVMAYRIEELLHLFESKAHPKRKPTMNVDILFEAVKPSHHPKTLNIQIKRDAEVAMKHIIHSHSIFSSNSPIIHEQFREELSKSDSDDEDEMYDSETDRYKKPSWFR